MIAPDCSAFAVTEVARVAVPPVMASAVLPFGMSRLATITLTGAAGPLPSLPSSSEPRAANSRMTATTAATPARTRAPWGVDGGRSIGFLAVAMMSVVTPARVEGSGWDG